MSHISIQELLNYTNQARTTPQKFAERVKKQLATFINQSTLPLIPGCNYATNQGKSAWKETITFLMNQKPLHLLELNEGLNLSAMDHAMDMKKNNFFDHQSSNGMSFSERITRRCGESYGSCAQNLGSDFDVTGRDHALQTIMGLIIDDGVKSRGHRKNIFNAAYKFVGIYAVKVGDKYSTVMNFHSENLKVKDSTKSDLSGDNKGIKVPQKYQYGGGKFGNDLSKEFQKMKLQDNKGEQKKMKNGGSGQKFVASKSTHTSTSTKNGKTTKVTTTKIKYSDGSTEEHVEQQTY